MPYTIDGYPYGKWDWITKATWKSSKPANEFMSFIGERRQAGFVSTVQKLGVAGSIIGNVIFESIKLLPIPGIGIFADNLKSAIISQSKKEIKKKLNLLYTKIIENLGNKNFSESLAIPIYADKNDINKVIDRFIALEGFDQSIVIHHIVNRWKNFIDDIVQLNFSKSIEHQKTFVSIITALSTFHYFEWFNKFKSGNELFSGDNAGFSLCHFASSDCWNPENSDDVDDMTLICRTISLIKITENKEEFENFIESSKNLNTEFEKEKNEKFQKNNNFLSAALLGLGIFGAIKK
ncbi:MAG: hypothetical protein ACTSVV_14425 [Promethearchaeota archaeon]